MKQGRLRLLHSHSTLRREKQSAQLSLPKSVPRCILPVFLASCFSLNIRRLFQYLIVKVVAEHRPRRIRELDAHTPAQTHQKRKTRQQNQCLIHAHASNLCHLLITEQCYCTSPYINIFTYPFSTSSPKIRQRPGIPCATQPHPKPGTPTGTDFAI